MNDCVVQWLIRSHIVSVQSGRPILPVSVSIFSSLLSSLHKTPRDEGNTISDPNILNTLTTQNNNFQIVANILQYHIIKIIVKINKGGRVL